jgi:hypothetical protein
MIDSPALTGKYFPNYAWIQLNLLGVKSSQALVLSLAVGVFSAQQSAMVVYYGTYV